MNTLPPLPDEFVTAFVDICTERRAMGQELGSISHREAIDLVTSHLSAIFHLHLEAIEADRVAHLDLRPSFVRLAAAAASIVERWS